MANSSTTFKPGGPPNKATRIPKGAGYGGTAPPSSGSAGRPTRDAAIVLAMLKADRIAAMKDNLIAMALESERDSDRISATMGFLKHEDPVQTIQKISLSSDPNEMTDDELDTHIRRAGLAATDEA